MQKLSFVCPPEQIVSVFTDFEFRINDRLKVLFMFAFKDKLDFAFGTARTIGGVDELLRGTRAAFPFAFQVRYFLTSCVSGSRLRLGKRRRRC